MERNFNFDHIWTIFDSMNPFDSKSNKTPEYKSYTFQSLDQDDKALYSQGQEPENPFISLNYSICLGDNFAPNSKSLINFHLQNNLFAENSHSKSQSQNSPSILKNSLNQISHKGSNEYEDLGSLNQASIHDSYSAVSQCETPNFFIPRRDSDSVRHESPFSQINTSEDDFEESPQDLSRKKEKKIASNSGRPRKNSNLLRNAPGLIFGRVKKGCKAYVEGNKEERDHEDEERLKYIQTILEKGKLIHLNFNEERFVKFLEKFNGSAKTWKSLKDACMEDKLNASIFLLCVDSFLSQDGEKDFENWVSEDRGSDVKSEIKRKKFSLLKKLHSTVGFLYRKSGEGK